MKEKLKVSNRREQPLILTLVPQYWFVRKAAKEFSVPKNKIQKAKLLHDQKSIITCPDLFQCQRISQQMFATIKEFYCDDDYSRQMPGKKDYVSLRKKEHMSKRLILCDLKELYAV